MLNRKLMWFALSKVPGLDAHYLERIIECIGDVEAVFRMKKSELQKAAVSLRIPERVTEPLLIVREFEYLKEYEELQKNRIEFVTREDAAFPKRLLNIKNAPFYLYCMGKLPSDDIPSLAVIGARNCSVYGKEITLCFSKVLSSCGVQIISGMARGIDGYAHKGTLDSGGYTCAVLGFGVDVCYPIEHTGLKKELELNGGIISEYPIGTPGHARNFPARNRLIAGLSDAVLVVEAAKKSGTLITVDYALEQGKTIFAIPGRIGDKLSEGCNDIIADGGKMVITPEAILPELGLQFSDSIKKGKKQKNKIILETQEKIVYACLDLQPRHIEQLISLSKLPQDAVLLSLMRLEMMGYVKQPVKNYYVVNLNQDYRLTK